LLSVQLHLQPLALWTGWRGVSYHETILRR
jgi:hypothetical protein